MLRILAGVLAGAMLVASAGGALAGFSICSICQTPDGFVALRSGPSARAVLLARMRPGHMVHLAGRGVSSWIEVRHWADGQVPIETDSRFREGRRGWVNRNLLDDCG